MALDISNLTEEKNVKMSLLQLGLLSGLYPMKTNGGDLMLTNADVNFVIPNGEFNYDMRLKAIHAIEDYYGKGTFEDLNASRDYDLYYLSVLSKIAKDVEITAGMDEAEKMERAQLDEVSYNPGLLISDKIIGEEFTDERFAIIFGFLRNNIEHPIYRNTLAAAGLSGEEVDYVLMVVREGMATIESAINNRRKSMAKKDATHLVDEDEQNK